MQHILLTGAGFSRNWGGWLADEAFEYLLVLLAFGLAALGFSETRTCIVQSERDEN
jgi:hypothetical protein